MTADDAGSTAALLARLWSRVTGRKPEMSGHTLPEEPDNTAAVAAAAAESLTPSARRHLAGLQELDAGYVEAAIALMPPGTTEALLAAEALRDGPEGYAPVLTPLGRRLLNHLASTEPLAPVVKQAGARLVHDDDRPAGAEGSRA